MVMGYPEPRKSPKHAKDYAPEEMARQPWPPLPTPGLEEFESDSGQNNPEKRDNVIKAIENKIGIPYKSIVGFFTVFIGQLVARATVNDIPVLPENVSGWLSLVGGSFVAAAVIYFKANVYTVPQAEAKVEVAIKKAA